MARLRGLTRTLTRPDVAKATVPSLQELIQRACETCKATRTALEHTQDTNQRSANSHRHVSRKVASHFIINPSAVRQTLPKPITIHATFHESQLKPVSICSLSPPSEPPPFPGLLMISLPTLCSAYWISDAGVRARSIWSNGRGMVRMSTPRCPGCSSWIWNSSPNSTGTIRRDQLDRLKAPVEGGTIRSSQVFLFPPPLLCLICVSLICSFPG